MEEGTILLWIQRTYKIFTGKYDNKGVPTLKLMGPSCTIGHDLWLVKERSTYDLHNFFSVQEL